jgi:terminal uridylyltransferase
MLHSAPGSTPSNIGLNDPSIIFAQPAARPMAIPSPSHDGHWPRTVAPNSLVNNGAVGNSGNFSFFLLYLVVERLGGQYYLLIME